MAIRTENGDYYYPHTSYPECAWCRGRGCLMCPQEEEEDRFRVAKPIFTARLDDQEEVEELRQVFGAQALVRAFSPDGGGLQEVEFNAAAIMLKRELRKLFPERGGPQTEQEDSAKDTDSGEAEQLK